MSALASVGLVAFALLLAVVATGYVGDGAPNEELRMGRGFLFGILPALAAAFAAGALLP